MRHSLGWIRTCAGLAAGCAALWLSGCGGAGTPTWSSTGPAYPGSSRSSASLGSVGTPATPAGIVRGMVEAPARPTGFARPIALFEWLRIGAPAYAEARLARMPLADARVCLIDRATRETVSTVVTTDAKGEFRIDRVTLSPRFSVRASEGQQTLEAVVPQGGDQEVRVVVNEATTVGAEAARQAEAEGLSPEGAVLLAQQITEAQEEYQTAHPAEVPDLTRPEEIQARARKHLLRTADAAVAAALKKADKAEAWHAVASAQYVAREKMKLPAKVRLTPAQTEALVSAITREETCAVNTDKLLAALKKGGIKARNGKAVTKDDLTAALASLRETFPSLKEVKLEKVPVLVALLMVEQKDTGFQVTSREQVKGFLKELVGEVDEKPASSKEKQQASANGKSAEAKEKGNGGAGAAKGEKKGAAKPGKPASTGASAS